MFLRRRHPPPPLLLLRRRHPPPPLLLLRRRRTPPPLLLLRRRRPPPPLHSSSHGEMHSWWRLLLASLLYLIASAHCLDLDRRKRHHHIPDPIKTIIVVIVMENRSFDHLLGWLKPSRADINDLTGREIIRLSSTDRTSPKVHVSDDAVFIDSEPGNGVSKMEETWCYGFSNTELESSLLLSFAP